MGDIMVETWALIFDSVVTNLTLWDGDTTRWQPPEGYLAVVVPEGSGVDIGWHWDGTGFTPPVAPDEPPALDTPGSAPDVIS